MFRIYEMSKMRRSQETIRCEEIEEIAKAEQRCV
jgi:hypothetical protein